MRSTSSFKNWQKNSSISYDYAVFALFIIVTILVLTAYYAFVLYSSNTANLQHQLKVENSRIQRTLDDIFQETTRMMVYIGKQIASHGAEDLDFINTLITSNPLNPYQSTDLLSWSKYDWVNPEGLQLVNSKHGIAASPPDMSHREYSWKSPQNPWTLQMSKPAVGNPSGMWVIPAGVGITDHTDTFLGTLVVGFNIAELTARVEQFIGNHTVSFLVLDTNGNIVLASADQDINPRSTYYHQYLEQGNLYNNPLFSGSDGVIHQELHYQDTIFSYYSKLTNTPYLILTGYNQNVAMNNFYTTLFPKIASFTAIGLFCLVILYLYRQRIIKPVQQLSNAAVELSKGHTDIHIPRQQSVELFNLAKSLLLVKNYTKRNALYQKQLEQLNSSLKASRLVLEEKNRELAQAKEQAVIAHDIADHANRAKSNFLANMSHELRTPLFTINGYAETLKQELYGTLNQDYRSSADNILTAGNHLLQLINDVLDLSKIAAGKMELDEHPININKDIKKCIQMVAQEGLKQGLRIETDIEDNLPALYGDRVKFRQIMLNLLSNAIKFTHAGGNITVRASISGGETLDISVEDNGIGVAQEDIYKILTDFGQANTSTIRKPNQGTGLGLPVVKKLMELHHGKLVFESTLGTGTIVTIQFPRKRLLFVENTLKHIA